MANENYLKIINLGKWLELYLDPKLKAWGYRELTGQAIELLNIDYRLTDDDVILKNIEVFEKLSPEDQVEFLSLRNTPHTDFEKSKFRSLFTFSGDWSLANFFSIYYLRKILLDLFQIIIKKEEPWAHTLDWYRGDKRTVLDIRWLMAMYSGLIEKIVFIEDRALVQKTFEPPFIGHTQLALYDKPKKTFHSPSCLPWLHVVPRIFFDFLLAGGQEYFGFCGFCGKFFVVQRKGRKKFCSDICRTANQYK